MDTDAFWAMIEQARRQTTDSYDRLELLADRLAELPLDEVVEFHIRLDEVRAPADTWAMWAAAECVFGGYCGTDSFWYFQVWLIGLGREVFERVTADPDALAEVPEVIRLTGWPGGKWPDDEWPEWEELNYVATNVHQERTGHEESLELVLATIGHDSPGDPDPTGTPWPRKDYASRLPRLSALFAGDRTMSG